MSYPKDTVIISQEDIDNFDAWYDEIEGFSLRCERAQGDITEEDIPLPRRNASLRHWMLWAFTMGRHSK
jgi:hypothetical protein